MTMENNEYEAAYQDGVRDAKQESSVYVAAALLAGAIVGGFCVALLPGGVL
jgi:hypothetical protein